MNRDYEGPKFYHMTKTIQDKNGIPIGTDNNNPILYTRMYGVEYQYGYKSSMLYNEVSKNVFAQVYENGNQYVLFQRIDDHHIDGTEVTKYQYFIVSKSGDQRIKETKKGW